MILATRLAALVDYLASASYYYLMIFNSYHPTLFNIFLPSCLFACKLASLQSLAIYSLLIAYVHVVVISTYVFTFYIV